MRIWLGSENKRAGTAGILWIPPQHCFIASCCCCRCAGSLRMMWRSATLAAHISPAGKRRPTVATVAGYSARIVCQSRCQYRTFIQGRIFCPHCLSKQVPYFHPNRIICLDCLSKQVPYFHPGPNILPGLSIKAGTVLSSKPDNLLGLSIKAGTYRTFIQGRIFCPDCLSNQVPVPYLTVIQGRI